MPTTFANTIDGNEILAKRSQCDYAGNDIQTTYAARTWVTSGLALKEDSANKAQTLDPSSTTDFPSSAAVGSYVNSSVATATATFLGNFTLADLGLSYPATDSQIGAALDSYTWPIGSMPTNNDYVYVEIQNPQTTGIDDRVERFKFDGSNWLYEYTLNNSSFTAAEKAAIDSGIDSTKVTAYDAHVADTTIHVTSTDKSTWNAKQDAISDLATIRSGAAEGATAVQPGDLATVATTGSYDDLVDKPTIPAAQVNSDWNSNSGVSQILNKPTLSTVATTGDYDDLSNKPSIPAAQVNSDWNATSGVSEILNKPVLATVATTGSYNDLSNTPSIPTATSDLTNDSGFITLSDVPAQVNADWNSSSGASEILNKPTIPSGTQLVPAATSADEDKVLTVDSHGVPAWASAQAPISAGDGIDITNNVVSAKVDGTTIDTNASGELTVIGGGGGGTQADWTEDDPTDPSYIENKPTPKTLTAGTNITITESSSTLTVAATWQNAQADWTETDPNEPAYIQHKPSLSTVATTGAYSDLTGTPTIPTVDQTYDGTSTNAQSGVAVADAIGNLPTNLSAAQLLALKQALGVDETVLYESSAGMQLHNGLQLPETLYNFERIRFYVASNTSNGTPVSVEVPIQVVPYPNGTIELFFTNGHDVPSNFKLSWKWKMTLSGTTLTLTLAQYWGQNGTTWTQGDNLNDSTVFKIVGVHRIASN